jgi:hypothetical protein
MKTTFENICSILYDFQEQYNLDSREEISEFLRTQDLGVPLAIAYHEKWVPDITPEGRSYVENSFADFLELFGLEDIGWTSFFDIEAEVGLEPEKE